MASPSDQASDNHHPRFLSFRSPPPSSDNALLPFPLPLPLPQPLLHSQTTPHSSPLPTTQKPPDHAAPLSARGNVPKKKSTKKRRKPRTTKRSNTTFIAADAANFRQMVQQVTGVRFDNPSAAFASSLLRPEALRAGGGGRPYDSFGTFPGSELARESTGPGGLLPAAMFDMPMLAEQRAAGLYGELLGLGPAEGVGEVGSGPGLEWAAATSFHT
ncbi:hypothetical protein MLD38_004522 [Melastoma candidum]|uniref:Uncharacterized protein n=1 Tax=Melastoma candidum TaxID=119954 RepID=A0ACB9S6D3_9MYRT|nr:hypothetical protein MLD38_004522 [Melastoma candidum]